MHLKYLSYVFRHKWYVFLAGLKLRIPLWRLILHDWSKFTPREWFPYARYFFGDYPAKDSAVVRAARRDSVLLRTKEDVAEDFDTAWNHHQHQNDHHWQYWIMHFDDGGTKTLPMPDVCRREMLADWQGAGRALGKPDTKAWYEANRNKMTLHPQTRAWIELQLGFSANEVLVRGKD